MANRIVIRKEGRVQLEVPITPDMIVGRHPRAHIQLEDPMMSREHARITVEGGRVFVTDTSTNGIKIAGKRIVRGQPREVQSGDVAAILPFELLFEIDAPSAARDLPPRAAPVPARPSSSPNLEHLLEQGIPLWTNAEDVELEVAEIIEETPDVKTFRLVGREPLLFSYRPGQFLTLELEIDGRPQTRCYTISSSPSRPHTLEITVKRAPNGLVSNYLHERVKLGDTLRVNGPAGEFSCFNYPSEKILCLAGGSGITPIMSMCRWIVDTRADVDVVVLLSFRSPADIIFRRELELMASRHKDLKIVFSVTSRGPLDSWTGMTGRLCSQVFQLAVPDLRERHIYLCGPNSFMDTVRECLVQLDFPTQNLHSESFGKDRVAPGAPARAREPAASIREQPRAATRLHAATFKRSGKVVHTDGATGLLELAEANGVDITAGCRMGSCLTCRVKCLTGEVRMDPNKLTPELSKQGYVLTCVGHAASDVVLDV